MLGSGEIKANKIQALSKGQFLLSRVKYRKISKQLQPSVISGTASYEDNDNNIKDLNSLNILSTMP